MFAVQSSLQHQISIQYSNPDLTQLTLSDPTMPYITSPKDTAQLFYRDYAPATVPQPFRADEAACKSPPQITLVFIHGWPMSSLMYDHLMLPLCETYRIRCIGIDRRGFGKSEWSGSCAKGSSITYETFADDTIHIIEHLKLGAFVFVAASMGCGETVLAWERSEFVRQHCKVSPNWSPLNLP
jgi:non-heme chloroperoxidase